MRRAQIHRYHVVLILIIAFGIAVRLPGLFSQFWLDEIWSLNNALSAHSISDILFRLKIDNNHHLNSIYLYLVGPRHPDYVYRLLAFVCGIGSIVVAAAIGRRDGWLTALAAAFVIAASYPLINYQSEARGYASVIFLALLSWYCLLRFADTRQLRYGAAFVVASCFGILAHPTFLFFLVAALAWFAIHMWHTQRQVGSTLTFVFSLFAVPLLFGVWFVVFVFAGTGVPRGDPWRVTDLLSTTLSQLANGPSGTYAWVTTAVLLCVFVASLWYFAKSGDDRLLFYFVLCLLLPGFVLALHPLVLFPRYFILPGTFLLLACCHLQMSKVLAGALITAFVVGMGLHTKELFVYGRGHYREAITDMVRDTRGPVLVASGQDFRTATTLAYHSRAMRVAPRLQYVNQNAIEVKAADWYIVDSQTPSSGLHEMTDRYGRRYNLFADYYACSLSGRTWHLYRRARDN